MGKSSQTNAYDPQIGAAAQANTALAEKAQNFSENYYNTQVAPLLEQMRASSAQTQERENQLFGLNMAQMTKANDRYDQFGVPAEQSYYDMVQRYSAPAEQERQAALALGDVRTAAAGQRGTMFRQMGAVGINPTSPAYTSALANMAVANTAQEAGAVNRARSAAKSLGMQLTSDAANFGRGGASSTLAFGQAAQGNAQGGFATASGALGGANQSAGVPLAGYGVAQRSYGSNLDAYTSLGTEDMRQRAASDAGMGQFLGTVLGAAISHSDRRLKKSIRRIGTMANGLNVYEFTYVWGGMPRVGVMADEVERIMPAAVSVDAAGYKMVDYGMLQCA